MGCVSRAWFPFRWFMPASPCGASDPQLPLGARRHENGPRTDRHRAAPGIVGSPPPCRYVALRSSGESAALQLFALMWSSPDVIGLFSNNVVSFSHNVVLRRLLFSLNSVSKPRMLSVRAVYVLSPLQLPIFLA